MTISVVIPLYNKEKSISRAVESVLAQAYRDFELIVVDDGSIDNSFNVVHQIKDDRIKIVRQTNQGECAARNRGVLESSYDLVAFLDADDEWDPAFLEKILKLVAGYPDCGLFGTSYKIADGDKLSTQSQIIHFPLGWQGVIENFYQIICDYFPFNSSSVLVKKKILKDVGGFPAGVKRGGDIDTWFRLYAVTKFAYLNEFLSTYHVDAENRSCDVYELPMDDYQPIQTLLYQVANQLLSRQDSQSAIDYVAKLQFPAIRALLREGNTMRARQKLNICRGTRRFAQKWRKLFFYSYLPVPLCKKAVTLKP